MAANLFRRKDLAMFKSCHPARSMDRSSACRNPCRNSYKDKDKLASKTPTKGSNCYTPAFAATRAPPPIVAPVVSPFVAFGSADPFVVRYQEDDLQRIFKTVLDSRPSVLVLAPVVAAALHNKSSCERLLKAWFPDIYLGKTHLKCYNFLQ